MKALSLVILTLFSIGTNAKGLIGTIGISGNVKPGLVGRTYGTSTTEIVAIVLGVILSILGVVRNKKFIHN